MTQRYFIELAYDGTNYHGWQIQPNADSVQGVLEEKFSTIFREKIAITGAGRTDTGVHASYYVAHFEINSRLNSIHKLLYKLNSFLPADIVLFSITEVDAQTHARFDAQLRSYEYHVITNKNPFLRDRAHRLSSIPDYNAMNDAAKILLQHEDFTSFSKLNTDVKTNNCDVKKAEWKQRTKDHWVLEISADRFLRNMVRAIVGTSLEVGYGKINCEDFNKIILAKDRSKAGFSVPPQGLFLSEVTYPDHLFVSQILD